MDFKFITELIKAIKAVFILCKSAKESEKGFKFDELRINLWHYNPWQPRHANCVGHTVTLHAWTIYQ